MAKITLKVSEERLNKKLTIGDMADAEGGSFQGMIKVLVPFVVGKNGGYMGEKEATKKVRALNMEELKIATDHFLAGVEEATDTTPKTDS